MVIIGQKADRLVLHSKGLLATNKTTSPHLTKPIRRTAISLLHLLTPL